MPKFSVVDSPQAEPRMFEPSYCGIQDFTKAALERHSTYVFFLAMWGEFQRRAWDTSQTPSEQSIWARRTQQINEILRAERDEGRNDV